MATFVVFDASAMPFFSMNTAASSAPPVAANNASRPRKVSKILSMVMMDESRDCYWRRLKE